MYSYRQISIKGSRSPTICTRLQRLVVHHQNRRLSEKTRLFFYSDIMTHADEASERAVVQPRFDGPQSLRGPARKQRRIRKRRCRVQVDVVQRRFRVQAPSFHADNVEIRVQNFRSHAPIERDIEMLTHSENSDPRRSRLPQVLLGRKSSRSRRRVHRNGKVITCFTGGIVERRATPQIRSLR